jgi:hypothetical protein
MSRDVVDYMVGVDRYPDTIRKCLENPLHDDYILADAKDIDRLFHPKSFDCVLASDLIEHLQKEDGFRLLDMMERIARKKVIVFTPNGFVPQDDIGGNEFQRHLSGWQAREMKELGYQVIGVHGWKPLRGEISLPRWWPADLWGFVSVLTQERFERIPEHAFQIMCVKNL